MSPAQRRLRLAIERMGETFTVGGVSHIGLAQPISATKAGIYLTEAESSGAGRPFRMIVVPPDDTTAAADTVTLNGSNVVAKKVIPVRVKGETVGKMVVVV